MRNRTLWPLLLVPLCGLAGCAFDVIHVDHAPTVLDTAATCGAPLKLKRSVTIKPSGGYERTLIRDTRWQCVGRIAEGLVYRSRDQVLTIEASNIYEANIVVADGQLTGFYLPVERAFSPLSTPVALETH